MRLLAVPLLGLLGVLATGGVFAAIDLLRDPVPGRGANPLVETHQERASGIADQPGVLGLPAQPRPTRSAVPTIHAGSIPTPLHVTASGNPSLPNPRRRAARNVFVGLEVVDRATHERIPRFQCVLQDDEGRPEVRFDLVAVESGVPRIPVPPRKPFDLHVRAPGFETEVLEDQEFTEDSETVRVFLERTGKR